MTPPSLDGFSALPAESAPKQPSNLAPKAKEPKKAGKGLLMLFYALVALYIGLGAAFMLLLPSDDVRLKPLLSLGVGIFGIGALFWFGFGLFAFLRILSVKNEVRIRRNALIRLLLIEIPTITISMLALFVITREPPLNIDLIDPPIAADLIAPVYITFGTDSANAALNRRGLTVVKYAWDFEGDGEINIETAETRITGYFPREGVFQVRAVAQLTNGTQKILTKTIQISRTQFSVEPRDPIVDEPATFSISHMFSDANAKDFLKAKWDFDGDGTFEIDDDQMNVTHTYRTTGPVTAVVEITNTSNATRTISRQLKVVVPPKQPFPVTLSTIPETLLGPVRFPVVFEVDTAEPVANVKWDFGDVHNGEMKEGIKALHTFEKVGNFIVTATVRSQSGAVAKLTKLVRVTDPLQIPDLSFTGTPEIRSNAISGEVPLSLDLTPKTSLPLITFSWDAPEASEILPSDDKTLKAVYRREGEYAVELIAVDADQKVLRQKISVTVKPPKPLVSVRIDPTSPVAPENVQFDASDTFINDKIISGFEWNFGDGTTKNAGAQISHLYDKPGTYQVRVKAITLDGATFSTEVTLVVREPTLDACFLPSRTSGTAPLGVRFETSCSTGLFMKWEWDFGDRTQSKEQNPTHLFTSPGTYVVTLKATDEEGHAVEEKQTIEVSAP